MVSRGARGGPSGGLSGGPSGGPSGGLVVLLAVLLGVLLVFLFWWARPTKLTPDDPTGAWFPQGPGPWPPGAHSRRVLELGRPEADFSRGQGAEPPRNRD